MSYIIDNIRNIDIDQWDELVRNSPTASFFATHECYQFYSELSFLTPFVFGVTENNRLLAVICGYCIADGNSIKKYFSRRAIIPGGILLDAQISEKALSDLLEYTTNALKNKAIYIEIRNYRDFSSYKSVIESAKFSYLPHLNFHVPTLDTESAIMQLNTTKRRDVRLSRKEGADWIETTATEDIKSYYAILSELYSKKIKTPLFPYEFFEKIVKLPNATLLVIKHRNELIGGSVCVKLPGKCVYEWFVCGLDGRFKNIFPSTLATWAGIEYAATHGFAYFDMMGAGKPQDNYGVREFKSKFGGVSVEYGRFLYICNPFFYSVGKKVIEFLKSK